RRSSMKPAEQQQNIRPVPPSACVDSWWRTHSATMALLKHTCAQMEEAEQLIAKQEARIRQLENLADTDCLTGLLNRRGFERLYAREQACMQRRGNCGAIFVLVDLDAFKSINDSCGHLAGDTCLRMVAGKLSA